MLGVLAPAWCPAPGPAPSPGFIEACRPALREEAPSGGRWNHEIKFDGYRAQAHLRNGQPAVYTRAGYDWTVRFQPIADALATLPATDLILDGEAAVADSHGVPDFGVLHADPAAGRKDRLLYYAFALLHLDGFDRLLKGQKLRGSNARGKAESRGCAEPCFSGAVKAWRRLIPPAAVARPCAR
jgi:bifunctional non-homologous end joining protein LigD